MVQVGPIHTLYWYGFQENLLRVKAVFFAPGWWVSDMVRCEWVVCDVTGVSLIVSYILARSTLCNHSKILLMSAAASFIALALVILTCFDFISQIMLPVFCADLCPFVFASKATVYFPC